METISSFVYHSHGWTKTINRAADHHASTTKKAERWIAWYNSLGWLYFQKHIRRKPLTKPTGRKCIVSCRRRGSIPDAGKEKKPEGLRSDGGFGCLNLGTFYQIKKRDLIRRCRNCGEVSYVEALVPLGHLPKHFRLYCRTFDLLKK